MCSPGRSAIVRALARGVLAGAAVLWTLVVAFAPHLASSFKPSDPAFRVAAAAYVAGSFLCHQRAERSFHVSGVQMPVCARCFGLYASFSAGALAAVGLPLVRRRRRAASPGSGRRSADLQQQGRLILAAAVPTAASVALEALGIWKQGPAIRSIAAIPLGLAVGWFVTFHAGPST